MKYVLLLLVLVGCGGPIKYVELNDGTKIEFRGQFDWNVEKHCVNKNAIVVASTLSSATKMKRQEVELVYDKSWKRIIFIKGGETKYFYFCE